MAGIKIEALGATQVRAHLAAIQEEEIAKYGWTERIKPFIYSDLDSQHLSEYTSALQNEGAVSLQDAFNNYLEALDGITSEQKNEIKTAVIRVARPLIGGQLIVDGGLTVRDIKSLSDEDLAGIGTTYGEIKILRKVFPKDASGWGTS